MHNLNVICLSLIAAFISSASGDQVTQSPSEVTAREGMEATLSCSYDVAAYNMFWYVQKPGQTLHLLLRETTKNKDLEEELKDRFFHNHDKNNKHFPLNITRLRTSDSGTYYCAVSPTLGGEHKANVQ
ncbi:hypothetical protein FKM82_026770 [Ascaphus truei]